MNTPKNSETCKKKFCTGFVKKQKKATERMTAKLKRTKNKSAMMVKLLKELPTGKKLEEELLEGCMKGYCNPSCKGTLYESGSKFPNSLAGEIKKKKGGPAILNITKSIRKSIFGNKTSVLKGDFYEKIPAKNVKEIKEKGAISGCTYTVLN